MVRKIVEIGKPKEVTPQMERAIMKAYEEFAEEDEEYWKAPYRSDLTREFRPSVCCDHDWKSALDLPSGVDRFLRNAFDEPDLGGHPSYCARCGAIGLFDRMPDRMGVEVSTLWVYDATAGLGQIRKGHSRDGRQERRKRA
jgi:hypothetical protein